MVYDIYGKWFNISMIHSLASFQNTMLYLLTTLYHPCDPLVSCPPMQNLFYLTLSSRFFIFSLLVTIVCIVMFSNIFYILYINTGKYTNVLPDFFFNTWFTLPNIVSSKFVHFITSRTPNSYFKIIFLFFHKLPIPSSQI